MRTRNNVKLAEAVSEATLRHHRGSAQKMRLVVDQIRGRNVDEALGLLRCSAKEVARPIEKLLRSAVANASNAEEKRDVDTLFVGEAFVGPGPSLKRVRGRAFGRAFRILHRTCHVTLKLSAKKPVVNTTHDDASGGTNAPTKTKAPSRTKNAVSRTNAPSRTKKTQS